MPKPAVTFRVQCQLTVVENGITTMVSHTLFFSFSTGLLVSTWGGENRGQGSKVTGQGKVLIFFLSGWGLNIMYEKLTMLNLQSGSTWTGPNNWYHESNAVPSQHNTGELPLQKTKVASLCGDTGVVVCML